MLQEVHLLVFVCAIDHIKPNTSINHAMLPYGCHDSTLKVFGPFHACIMLCTLWWPGDLGSMGVNQHGGHLNMPYNLEPMWSWSTHDPCYSGSQDVRGLWAAGAVTQFTSSWETAQTGYQLFTGFLSLLRPKLAASCNQGIPSHNQYIQPYTPARDLICWHSTSSSCMYLLGPFPMHSERYQISICTWTGSFAE